MGHDRLPRTSLRQQYTVLRALEEAPIYPQYDGEICAARKHTDGRCQDFAGCIVAPRLEAAIRARPIDPPAAASHRRPDEALGGRSARMVVERRGALVEAARMPGVPEPEPLVVEMVAELVAQRAQERPEGSDVLENGRPHPDANDFRFGMIVAEQLGGRAALVYPEGPGRQDADSRPADLVEVGGRGQKIDAGAPDGFLLCGVHGDLYGCGQGTQAVILRQVKGAEPVAFTELGEQRLLGWRAVGNHGVAVRLKPTILRD